MYSVTKHNRTACHVKIVVCEDAGQTFAYCS